MKRILILAALCMGGSLVAPAYAATEAECNVMWQKADRNNDGVLSDAEATRYLAALRVRDRQVPADSRFTSASFLEACKADAFMDRPVDAGAPLKGANSFTEGQARDRAVAHGVGDVTGLAKDDDGIWRGKGMVDGKSVAVAVDFKGNVVTQ